MKRSSQNPLGIRHLDTQKKKAWYPTGYEGVRYREHKTLRHHGKPDRYFSIRYRLDGKLKEEGIGWASEGWNAVKASEKRAELKRAQRTGEGERTLAEKRQKLQEQERAEKERKEREAREGLTFGTIFEEIYYPQAKADKKPRSYKTEESLFRLWIAPVIGDLPLKDIAPTHVDRIKKNMGDAGRAERTRRYALEVIRQVFNFARDRNLYYGDSPTSKVKWPKTKENKRLRWLSQDEADKLLDALAAKSQQLHDIALVSLHTGARADQIFSLSWADVDLENEKLTFKDTKSGKTKIADMTGAVKEMLTQKKRGDNDALVFPSKRGGKIEQISKAFNGVVDDLKLNEGITDSRDKVVFHTFRHTYASWLVKNGESLYTVQKVMGHSTIAMTERYSHLSPDTLKEATKRFESSLNRKGKSKIVPIPRK